MNSCTLKMKLSRLNYGISIRGTHPGIPNLGSPKYADKTSNGI